MEATVAEEVGLEYASLEEADEVLSIVQSIVDSKGTAARTLYPRYQQILAKYQEQPQLLDAYLESIVQPLALLMRSAALADPAQRDLGRVQDVARLLHVLVVVRGHKTVVRFFPHEAADLERVLQVLQLVRAASEGKDPQQQQQQQLEEPGSNLCTWEAQSVLLLWLSMLVLTPFNLSTVDSAATNSGSSNGQRYTPLAATLLQLGESYLHHPGSVRNMAGLLLARLLTRPDMGLALVDFLEWQRGALVSSPPSQRVFLLPGVLHCLALLFKIGSRPRLLPHAGAVWQQLEQLAGPEAGGGGGSGAEGFAGNSLARKLGMKLAQRIGLLLLPAAQPNWRYQRQAASLDATLGAGSSSSSSTTAAAAAGGGGGGGDSAGAAEAPQAAVTTQLQQLAVAASPAGAAKQQEAGRDGNDVTQPAPDQILPGAPAAAAGRQQEEGVEEDFELPEEVEGILGLLLSGMGDKDTGVRWAAAKGLGRAAGCLPLELAEEVVDNVVGVFNPRESDAAWHGGCLALAELARRCLLLPHRLPALAPIITAALRYDVRRGPHSVGAHVRDAAAYVCWGFARAYEPHLLQGCVEQLAGSLLVMACYDREVNCRRAAASAFQECVGRLGNFPHGMDILGVANYYSVGNIHCAYLHVAPYVAQFPEYAQQLADHLMQQKLRHWERSLRALAARGLAALVAAVPSRDSLVAPPLQYLLPLVTDDVLEVRSGALVGVAELLPALAAAGVGQLPGGLGTQVVEVLSRLAEGKFYRGKGGDMLREVAARFVEQAATAGDRQLLRAYAAAVTAEQRQRQLQVAQGGEGSPSAQQQLGAGGPAFPTAAAPAAEEPAAAAAAAAVDDSQLVVLELPLTDTYHAHAARLLQDCITQAAAATRAVGAAALAAYAAAHCAQEGPRAALLQLVAGCCRDLTSANTAARRGATAALGVVPLALLEEQEAAVVQLLCGATQPEAVQEERDVESRAAAVTSLGQLSVRLLQHSNATTLQPSSGTTTTSSSSSSSCGRAAALVDGYVLPCLVAALQDYETDNRGDVGSWVREAAMQAATEVLLAVATTSSSSSSSTGQAQRSGQLGASGWQEADQQQQRLAAWQHHATTWCRPGASSSAAGTTAAPDAAAAAAEAPDAAAAAARVELQDAAVGVVGGLLEQGLGRIARLREAAVIHLRQLLTAPATARVLPAHQRLLAALPTDAEDISSISSLVTLERLSTLLPHPVWCRPVLLGLIGSMGAVDASLSAAAGAALLAAVAGGGGGGVAAGAGAGGGLQEQVARLVVELWKHMGSGSRLAVAFLRTALLLLTKAGFTVVALAGGDSSTAAATTTDTSPSSSSTQATTTTTSSSSSSNLFAAGVLVQLKGEVKGCGDVVRLLEAADLAVQLVGVGATSDAALQTVLLLLLNRFPKVRRHTAEQLYLLLLARQAELEEEQEEGACEQGNDPSSTSPPTAAPAAAAAGLVTPGPSAVHGADVDTLEAVLDTLLVTAWDGPVEEARSGRQALADALGVEIKAKPVAGARRAPGGPAGVGAPGYGAYTDNMSYQSLLDDAARGGGY